MSKFKSYSKLVQIFSCDGEFTSGELSEEDKYLRSTESYDSRNVSANIVS